VTYDAASATLLFYPIKEVSLLRSDTLYNGSVNLTFMAPSVDVCSLSTLPALTPPPPAHNLQHTRALAGLHAAESYL